jgi:hypothetical protein
VTSAQWGQRFHTALQNFEFDTAQALLTELSQEFSRVD